MDSLQQLSKVQLESVSVGDSEIKPICSVRNLGAWFDKNLSTSKIRHFTNSLPNKQPKGK